MVVSKAMKPNTNHVVNSVNLNNDNKNSNRDFNPSVLGREFVRQYYTMLNEGPQNLFRFYSDDSSLIHGNEPGESVLPAYGHFDINKKLMSLNFRDCHTKIRQVDSLETDNKSVVIQVIGELSNNGQPMRRFFQTFILAPRSPTHYYVRNDIFRYQDEVFIDDDDYVEEKTEDLNHVEDALDHDESVHILNSSLVMNKLDKMNGNASENEKLSANVIDRNKFSCMNPDISPINANVTSESDNSTDNRNLDKLEKSTVHLKENLKIKKVNEDQKELQLSSSVIVESSKNEPRTYATMVQRKFGIISTPSNSVGNIGFEKKIIQEPSTTILKSNQTDDLNVISSLNEDLNLNNNKPKDKENILSENHNLENWSYEQQNSNEINENLSSSNDLSNKRIIQQHSDDQQVFVGNLPQNIDEEQLRQFFVEYGEIVDVRINRTNQQKQGKTPNYGFITFSETSVVKKILSKKPIYFNNHRINVEEKRSQSGRIFNNNQGNYMKNQNNNLGGSQQHNHTINHMNNSNRNFNSSSGSSNNQFCAFNSRGMRDLDNRNNRGFNSDKRKTTINLNSNIIGGNRIINNFNRR